MTEPQIEKLKMKIGTAEFEAEANSEIVKERLALFAELVSKQLMAAPQIVAAPPPKNYTITPETGRAGIVGHAAIVEGSDGVSSNGVSSMTDDVLARVFRRTEDEVSLLALPRTEQPEADALIALLYAFQRLLNKPNVTGVTLMQAARQSGVTVNRADVVLKSKSDLVMAAGVRRGRRYSLNNRGVSYAEVLIRKLIE